MARNDWLISFAHFLSKLNIWTEFWSPSVTLTFNQNDWPMISEHHHSDLNIWDKLCENPSKNVRGLERTRKWHEHKYSRTKSIPKIAFRFAVEDYKKSNTWCPYLNVNIKLFYEELDGCCVMFTHNLIQRFLIGLCAWH